MMSYPVRLRYLLAKYGGVVALVLLLVGIGMIASVALGPNDFTTSPDPELVTEQTHVERYGLVVNDSGVVTGNSSLWRRGARVSESPVYFTGTFSNLTLTVRATMPSEQRVTVTPTLEVVYVASHDGDPFWQSRRTIVRDTATVTNGSLTTTGRVDLNAISDRRRSIQQDLSADERVSISIVARMRYTSERYQGTLTTSTPLLVSPESYSLPADLEDDRTHTTPIQREVMPSSDGIPQPSRRSMAGGVTLLVGLVLGIGRVRSPPASAVKTELRRARYDEWISRGSVTLGAGSTTARMDSFVALADVAIDANRRIVHDTDRGVYAVVVGDIVYQYSPPNE